VLASVRSAPPSRPGGGSTTDSSEKLPGVEARGAPTPSPVVSPPCSLGMRHCGWHIEQGFCAIPKSVKPHRIAENFDVFEFALEAEEVATIDAPRQGRARWPGPRHTEPRDVPEGRRQLLSRPPDREDRTAREVPPARTHRRRRLEARPRHDDVRRLSTVGVPFVSPAAVSRRSRGSPRGGGRPRACRAGWRRSTPARGLPRTRT
jgi:hypothetical protein